ncbi:MAG: ABC transporter permease [Flammeovirgaceae bacterium]
MNHPPKLCLRFFRWYCHPKLVNHIEGDLLEEYGNRLKEKGKWRADLKFCLDVLLLFRPGIIRPMEGYQRLNSYGMYKSYAKTGWRNLVKDKGYSFINIGGLALGMTVTILIGLWVWDELSYNKHFANYNRIGAVMQNMTYGETVETTSSQSLQLGTELRTNYGNNFKHVVMSSFTQSSILSNADKALIKTGSFMESGAPEMLTLQMLKGERGALKNLNAILLSEATATALFGDQDPMGEMLKINDRHDVAVAGVYKDIPANSSFSELLFIAPLDLMVSEGNRNLGWINNWLEVYVVLEDGVDMATASLVIKDAKLKRVDASIAQFKPELFLFPLSRWRLYGSFENGINAGDRIILVWLFGTIGVIVLLLACINFMNLSTARAEKRAKEVGIRKVIGSRRSQLICQFFIESFLMVALGFLLSLLLTQLALPLFNTIAGKTIVINWANPWLWTFAFCAIMITAFVAGSYPAFYLSHFSPGKVLKGTFRAGRFASIPRKVLVVTQFTVSIALVIGTVVIYQQVQHVRSRPMGYHQNGLVVMPMKTPSVKKNYSVLRNQLLASGFVTDVSSSECAVTDMYWSDGGFEWKGKTAGMQENIYRGAVDFDFGKTVSWKIKEGRDFSREYSTDSSAMILNEAAVDYMGLQNPIGETVKRYGRDYTVIGVVEGTVSQSLYEPPKPTYYVIDVFNFAEFIHVKLTPQQSVSESLQGIEQVFKKNNPDVPFEFEFVDDRIANKFAFEAAFGTLVGIFATLAIIISCLGLFGLAAFMAGQRTKEIGIRKVVGASVLSVCKLLSKDFILLILISCGLAIPLAYFIMSGWLQQYQYRVTISVWVLVGTCVSALVITLLTVSYQSIKAALANPVNSLRSE